MQWMQHLAFSGNFMPHGYCYLWNPSLIWLHVVSDSLITIAYLSIPITLLYFARSRADLPFHWMFLCFGTFIVACGATHAMEVWNLWHAAYWSAGAIKAITAAASVSTAILLVPVVPKALALPHPEELRQSEERFRLLVSSVKDYAIFMLDPKGSVVSWNKEAERIQGYRAEEIVGQHFSRFYSAEDAERSLPSEELDAALEKGRFEEEGWRFRKDGSRFWATVVITALRDGTGKLLGFGNVVGDMTDRKRGEELEEQLRQSQKMEAIGLLAGGVAHDFNNLLGVIIGYSETLMGSEGIDKKMEMQVEQIRRAADRGASLTRQLLAYSRQQELASKIVNLNSVVSEMEPMLRRLISEDVELQTSLDPELASVSVDPGQFEQVILNLAVNAQDAMPEGGKLIIETRNVDMDETYALQHPTFVAGRYVLLSVADTGIGMSQEIQKRIFEPFFTTKERGKGTGLGLASVYGIVKQSGGHVWTYSEPGKGSTFKIYLPLVEKGVRNEIEPVRNDAIELRVQPTLRQTSETILLVEDESSLRELERTLLEDGGYTVLEAENGVQALKVAGEYRGPIHILLTDVVMPSMGGPTLAKHLSTLHPETKVLYMSGYTGGVATLNGFLEPGMNLLHKPFSRNELLNKLREVLDSDGAGGQET